MEVINDGTGEAEIIDSYPLSIRLGLSLKLLLRGTVSMAQVAPENTLTNRDAHVQPMDGDDV